jgi:hypothetical protein
LPVCHASKNFEGCRNIDAAWPVVSGTRHRSGMVMETADEYRRRAEQCLREAEIAPAHLRLQLLVIAQKWFALAEAVSRLATESKSDASDEN